MTWQKNPPTFNLMFLVLTFFLLSACGVKGDPVPPERPPSLGRGRPTYKRATEDIKIERRANRPSTIKPLNKDEDEETENEESEE